MPCFQCLLGADGWKLCPEVWEYTLKLGVSVVCSEFCVLYKILLL